MKYDRLDICSVYAERVRLSALLKPIEDIEDTLAASVVVADVSGRYELLPQLRADFKLAKAWTRCGSDLFDAVTWDLDRLAEDKYDGTVPAWVIAQHS